MKICARHQSGHWSEVDTESFVHNVLYLRKPSHPNSLRPTLISRTELTDQASNKALSKHLPQADSWEFYHPYFPGSNRLVDCGLEWDSEYWKLQDKGLRVLTDFRVTTAKSQIELLPSSMPWVLLESKKQPNWLLLFSAAHNNLDNTPRRAAAWVEEGHTFKGFQKRQAAHHRGNHLHRLHQCDANKNIRLEKERLQMRNGMLAGTGMKWGWNHDHLPKKNTQGKQIIDYSCSNMECRGNTKIGGNTGFSDHNWIETTWHG